MADPPTRQNPQELLCPSNRRNPPGCGELCRGGGGSTLRIAQLNSSSVIFNVTAFVCVSTIPIKPVVALGSNALLPALNALCVVSGNIQIP